MFEIKIKQKQFHPSKVKMNYEVVIHPTISILKS